MLAQHSPDNPTGSGGALHNESAGEATWGSGVEATDWRVAAERGGNAILSVNPSWLIVVEGIEAYQNHYYWWGGNLMGARQFPVRLVHPAQLVYSAHDYGPDIWPQTWFQAPNFPRNLPAVWQSHWAYLQTEGIAPVYLGEFGGGMGQRQEALWQTRPVKVLIQNTVGCTYSHWNPDSAVTAGVLNKDWTTVDKARMDILRSYMWPMLTAPAS